MEAESKKQKLLSLKHIERKFIDTCERECGVMKMHKKFRVVCLQLQTRRKLSAHQGLIAPGVFGWWGGGANLPLKVWMNAAWLPQPSG